MIQFQVHNRGSYSPMQLFIVHDSNDKTSGTILTQEATLEVVSAMREAADKMEAMITADTKKQAIEERIKAEMEAEGAA